MKSKTPWWQSLYLDPNITQIMFGWRTNTKVEVDQILRQMKLKSGARLLDLACGQGRHAIEFSKRGFQVVGLDFSPLLLSEAMKSAQRLPKSKRPTFVEGDMRNLRRLFPADRFDAVINLWNAWGYFSRRSDDQRTLQGIRHVLPRGGQLVINTLNEGGVIHRLKDAKPRWRMEGKGRYFLESFDYEPSKKKIAATWILLEPKKRIEKTFRFSQNVYSTSDFKRELSANGMKMTKLWGMLEGSPYSATSWHQTVVARKL